MQRAERKAVKPESQDGNRHTLTHQRQGRNECLPTAVAVLAGIPKDDVIAWARERDRFAADVTWNDFAYSSGDFWKYARPVLNHFIGEGYGQTYYTVCTFGFRTRRVYEADGCTIPQPRRRRTLHGRGLIVIKSRLGGHAAAFENGVVYDGCADGPLSYRAWRNDIKGWRVSAVLYVPVKGATT